MEKRWGAKATPMAKKIYQNKARKNKIVTVIDNSKAKNK
jgi:predicted acetyltransferase